MAIDTAAKGVNDPVITKPKPLLPSEDGNKFNCDVRDSPNVIELTTHIDECLRSSHLSTFDAWNGKMGCQASGDPRIQEFDAMVETARQLYEQHTQKGSPPMNLFSKIHKEMSGMNFHVTTEAAQFATEARIHHMCAVAGLIRNCCLGGPAYTLVTNLGTERFTEWKTALINEATGKMQRLFGKLENGVLRGKFQPGKGALDYVFPTPGHDINMRLEDMAKLRKVMKDLRISEGQSWSQQRSMTGYEPRPGGAYKFRHPPRRAPTAEGRAAPTDSGPRVTPSQAPDHQTRSKRRRVSKKSKWR
jgi:hypothetical protein